ncbi:MAG TPA: hypothetical protein VK277_13155 [Acidimicrobiales bacterium]|nr:hypothetical protein [Acidimicrobiales bacterium]
MKGTTWRRSDAGPRRRQTNRRLSSKDGTVPTAVATRFAHSASKPTTPTSNPSVVRLVSVETTDTAA